MERRPTAVVMMNWAADGIPGTAGKLVPLMTCAGCGGVGELGPDSANPTASGSPWAKPLPLWHVLEPEQLDPPVAKIGRMSEQKLMHGPTTPPHVAGAAPAPATGNVSVRG